MYIAKRSKPYVISTETGLQSMEPTCWKYVESRYFPCRRAILPNQGPKRPMLEIPSYPQQSGYQ